MRLRRPGRPPELSASIARFGGHNQRRGRASRWIQPITVIPALSLLGLAILAPTALLVVAYDGLASAVILAAALGAGLWLTPLLRLIDLPLRWQWLLAAALGLGALALLALGLGVAGVLQRGVWVTIIIVLVVAGAARVVVLERRRRREPSSHENADGLSPLRWLTLLTVPFAVLALDVATVPPGFLWRTEGFGYDALEYHLELPKEYRAQGRIAYAPHNVYANFPANVEMLYLLCMVLRGDPIDGAMSAQVLNLALAGLTVAAVWVGAREWSRGAAAIAVTLIGTVGWLPYLCGVAFVENGLLFFTAVACAALIRAARGERTARWLVIAGVTAGFAAGCKYTGITLLALPIGVAVLLIPAPNTLGRLRNAGVFAATALLTFAPWVAKNVAFTGNPLFPLANTVFKAYPPGWGPAESKHFDECHQPAPDERSAAARVRALWRQVAANEDGLFGPLVLLAPLGLLVTWRSAGRGQLSASTVALLAMLAAQTMAWLVSTHLYARFAVVLILPLSLLGALALSHARSRTAMILIATLVTAGAALNCVNLAQLYLRHFYSGGERLRVEGATELFSSGMAASHEHLAVINKDLPPDAGILIIGDARAFYFQRPIDYCAVFNRNPFIEVVRSGAAPAEIIEWLRQGGYTHVFVNWAEIDRLRRSRYGFADEVRPNLFAALVGAGLRPERTFDVAHQYRRYADLYAVPRG